jgi:hypothetical protein
LRTNRDNIYINGKAKVKAKQPERIKANDPLDPDTIEIQRLDLEDDFAVLRTIFPEDFKMDEFISIKPIIGKRRRADTIIEAILEVQDTLQGLQKFQGDISTDFQGIQDLEFQAFGNDYWDHVS